jgi:hypothetical protein
MRQAVTTQAAPWDFGPKSLAAILPNADHDVVGEFRAYLKTIGVSNSTDRALKRHAKSFCELNGYKQHTEAAIEVDATTGKRSNPNGATRRKKRNWIETMRAQGKITADQLQAALDIQKAYDTLQKSPPCIKEINVDSSAKPDADMEIKIDRISKFREVMRCVPRASRVVVNHVVLDNKAINAMGGRAQARQMDRLRVGLDAVSNATHHGRRNI